MSRIVSVNAGGRVFQTFASTLLKFPQTNFASQFAHLESVPAVSSSRRKSTSAASRKAKGSSVPSVADDTLFIDVDPAVFEHVLQFLRTGRMVLPTNNEPLRHAIMHYLSVSDLMGHAFPAEGQTQLGGDQGDTALEESEEGGAAVGSVVLLPDVCVVQLCDHMQHDQGVKRHALTISYGADGFQLRGLTKRIRKDLNTQLSSTYWQVYQTNERAAFFVTTKVANGTADLMTTSITQQVIEHTERMGYSLTSSYVTLSPDVVHTNVRMLIHNFIFRRVRLPTPDAGDALIPVSDGESEDGEGASFDDDGDNFTVHPNFEPRAVGPQKGLWDDAPSVPVERVRDIWKK